MSVVYQYEDQNTSFSPEHHSKKKLLFIVALVIMVVTIMLVVVALGTSKNTKEGALAGDSSVASTKTEVFETAGQALGALQEKDFASLKPLIAPTAPSAEMTKEQFSTINPQLESYSSCSIDSSNEENITLDSDSAPTTAKVTLLCNNDASAIMELRLDTATKKWKFYLLG